MLKVLWLLSDIFLILIIFTRVPNNDGLDNFGAKNNLLGSANSAQKTLNRLTWGVILCYFILAVKFNF